MSWPGTMKCVVHNGTGGSITKVEVDHDWSGNNDPMNWERMDADFSSDPFDIHVGPGDHDHWSLRFTDGVGSTYYRVRKQCDIEEGDYNSGQLVKIDLGPVTQGFSIITPVSSSCLNNYYDKV